MDKLVDLLSGASKTRGGNDDDFADRLSSRYTVVLLVTFAVLVSLNQYVRDPITCWAPVHFTDAHTKFTKNYCWVKNTYYLPWSGEVPREEEDERRQMIPYYQWIPFILLSQAVLFYLPSVVWHGLNSKAGVDSDNILATAHALSRVEKTENHDNIMLTLTNQMDRFLSSRNDRQRYRCDLRGLASSICCRFVGRRLGNYLVLLFLFSKLVYIANIFLQLYLLNHVLDTKYHSFGIDVLHQMALKNDWTEDSYVAFPRVTLCDFKIRGQDLANTQRYTVQCVLPINLYNEKIYLFLWFWMTFVALISIASFLIWAVRAVLVSDQVKFVRNHLLFGGQIRSGTQGKEVETFTRAYLKQDGSFLMRLIAHNTNNIATTEIVCALWEFWKMRKDKLKEEEEEESTPSLSYPDNGMDTLHLRKNTLE